MFKKKRCNNCGKKISDNFDFCPHCGSPLGKKNKKEDWGLLGKNDFNDFNEINFYPGMNVIFNSLLKNLEKQFRNLNTEVEKNKNLPDNKNKKINKQGISISISLSGNKTPKIRVSSVDNKLAPKKPALKEKLPPRGLSEQKIRKISKLPREEPQTNIRRLGDRVVYEITLPGVKSLDDISIIKLENSIEIKALTKNKSYSKIIPINLPITNYNFSNEKLILELGTENGR